MKKEEVVDVKIFGIDSDADMRIEYPELNNIEEFKVLDKRKVKLCYYIGNRTSPIFNMEKQKKVKKALELVYGKNYAKKQDLLAIENGDIPQDILAGIERMLLFNPEYRFRAKMLSQYIFETLSEVTILKDGQMAAMDMDEKKKYTDLLIKVNSELPDMIKTMETGFGVKTISRETKNTVKVNINDVMK